jgi:DNA-binding transcriptional regulator YiaG
VSEHRRDAQPLAEYGSRVDETELRALLDRGVRDAAALAGLRAALGLERAEMGALLGVSEEHVIRWETGADAPDAATWSLLERLVRDHLALRAKLRDPGEWIARPSGSSDDI